MSRSRLLFLRWSRGIPPKVSPTARQSRRRRRGIQDLSHPSDSGRFRIATDSVTRVGGGRLGSAPHHQQIIDQSGDGVVIVEASGNLHSAHETGAECVCRAETCFPRNRGRPQHRVDNDRRQGIGPCFVGGSGAVERLIDGQKVTRIAILLSRCFVGQKSALDSRCEDKAPSGLSLCDRESVRWPASAST